MFYYEEVKRESGFIQFVLLFVILLISVVISILYLNNRSTKVETKPNEKAEVNRFNHPAFFPKRAFDESSAWILATGKSYPREIQSISDNEIIGFQCENRYDNDYNGRFQHSGLPMIGDHVYTITTFSDDHLISILTEKAKKAEVEHNTGPLSSIQICNTEEDRQFVIYGISNHGGGSGQDTYVTYLKGDGSLEKETYLPVEGSPYFGCFKPLMLTSKHVLYMNCGGGDGGYGSTSLYKFDLEAKKVDLLLKCESSFSESTGQTQENCSDSL